MAKSERLPTIDVAVFPAVVFPRLRRRAEVRNRVDEKTTVFVALALGVLLAPVPGDRGIRDVLVRPATGDRRPASRGPSGEPPRPQEQQEEADGDVKATDPFGRRWVIQCKHRRDGLAGSAVGTPDLQALDGTARQVHGADVAVIVTNGRVTQPGVAFARRQRLHVVDRHTLARWASGSRPLGELLRAVPPPRGPTAMP
ncbi:restriction endonuclease [Streptomyces sp. NPDC056503]|uniref:restriction endonuclease n=1 Tax=Streptomyces sp. NPDC056503 TaxID=3345842 RepID=UPI0036BB0820